MKYGCIQKSLTVFKSQATTQIDSYDLTDLVQNCDWILNLDAGTKPILCFLNFYNVQ